MNTSKHVSWLSVILLLAVFQVGSQEKVTSQIPPKYRMELVSVFEANTPEFIFVIGNTGFKSVASLKKFLSYLPPGSTLEWEPGCMRIGSEPLLSFEQEMKEFKAFCVKRNINFILMPSG